MYKGCVDTLRVYRWTLDDSYGDGTYTQTWFKWKEISRKFTKRSILYILVAKFRCFTFYVLSKHASYYIGLPSRDFMSTHLKKTADCDVAMNDYHVKVADRSGHAKHVCKIQVLCLLLQAPQHEFCRTYLTASISQHGNMIATGHTNGFYLWRKPLAIRRTHKWQTTIVQTGDSRMNESFFSFNPSVVKCCAVSLQHLG